MAKVSDTVIVRDATGTEVAAIVTRVNADLTVEVTSFPVGQSPGTYSGLCYGFDQGCYSYPGESAA